LARQDEKTAQPAKREVEGTNAEGMPDLGLPEINLEKRGGKGSSTSRSRRSGGLNNKDDPALTKRMDEAVDKLLKRDNHIVFAGWTGDGKGRLGNDNPDIIPTQAEIDADEARRRQLLERRGTVEARQPRRRNRKNRDSDSSDSPDSSDDDSNGQRNSKKRVQRHSSIARRSLEAREKKDQEKENDSTSSDSMSSSDEEKMKKKLDKQPRPSTLQRRSALQARHEKKDQERED
jgi:hypothetical protein